MLRSPISLGLAIYVLAIMAFTCHADDVPKGVLFGKFIGSTPSGQAIIKSLPIPESKIPELKDVECTWTLELFENADHTSTTYRATCEYGKYSYHKPKSGQKREAVVKEGKWIVAKSKTRPELRVIELDCGLRLMEVSKEILHFVDAENHLLVGDGGYSYSLHRADVAEKPGDWHLAMAKPDGPAYKIAPLSTGASVYGVYEGRTPYKGIAAQLKQPWDEGNLKAKWRLTLYQDEKTKAPTEYKIEGTFFKPEARTGKWTLEKGIDGVWPRMVLAATKTQPELVLLMGDENVLFIADEAGKPRVGHADFSYTLNRKSKSAE